MAGINSSRLDANGFFLGANDGRSVEVTRQQVMDFYNTTSGSAASRRAQTLTWVRNQILAVFGDIILPEQLEIDVDATRTPSLLRLRNDII